MRCTCSRALATSGLGWRAACARRANAYLPEQSPGILLCHGAINGFHDQVGTVDLREKVDHVLDRDLVQARDGGVKDVRADDRATEQVQLDQVAGADAQAHGSLDLNSSPQHELVRLADRRDIDSQDQVSDPCLQEARRGLGLEDRRGQGR